MTIPNVGEDVQHGHLSLTIGVRIGTITLEDGLTYSYIVECACALYQRFHSSVYISKETPINVYQETFTTVLLGA